MKVTANGKLEVQPFGAGVVVPAFKVFEVVQDGIVDAVYSTPSYLVNQGLAKAIGCVDGYCIISSNRDISP